MRRYKYFWRELKAKKVVTFGASFVLVISIYVLSIPSSSALSFSFHSCKFAFINLSKLIFTKTKQQTFTNQRKPEVSDQGQRSLQKRWRIKWRNVFALLPCSFFLQMIIVYTSTMTRDVVRYAIRSGRGIYNPRN